MQKSKFVKVVFALTVCLVVGFGCKFPGEATGGKLKVVATLFPQYDFTREIGRQRVEVMLLVPPGVEAHSYEPAPQDIIKIRSAKVFTYTGEFMEPWAHKVIETVRGRTLVVVDASKGLALLDEAEQHESGRAEAKHGDRHHHGKDPHIWLDPVYARTMVDNIVAGLGQADPANRHFYRKNGEVYKQKLGALHRKFTSTLQKAKQKKIIYGGHFAFGYFAKRYGLEYLSPYTGFAPDAEPTPQRIAELVKNMNATSNKVIYYEELIEPKVAKVIAEQTGAKMLLLHGAHNLTKSELKSGITYLQIMEGNLVRLKKGLGIK